MVTTRARPTFFFLENFAHDAYSISMGNLFIPYSGKHPAHVTVNGHKIVLCALAPEPLEDSLEMLGGDAVLAVDTNSFASLEDVFVHLGAAVQAKVVLAPEAATVPEVLTNLQEALPWIQ